MDPLSNFRRSAFLLSGLVPFLLASTVHAQRLVGHVIEEESEEPIEAVSIVIVDAEGRTLKNTTSDEEGWFQFSMAAPGAYTIRVTHIAYTTYDSEAIDMARGETVEIRVRLGASVIPLEPLEVTARSAPVGRLTEFHRRLEERAFGRFIAREDIEARPFSRVTDLLRVQPGVTIQSVRSGPFERSLITMRGGSGACLPALYIDGIRVRQSADFPIDDLLNSELLEGVEIYSMSAGAPAQYQDANHCGVVLFWTRQGEPGRGFSWKRLIVGTAAAGLLIFFLAR